MKDEACMSCQCLYCVWLKSFRTFPFALLYLMTGRESLHLSSKLHQFKRCSMSRKLDVSR